MCIWHGESWCPLSMPRGMWGAFLPYESPNDAYNTVDINVGAYNTVGTNVRTSHTACVRLVVEHCSRRSVLVPWFDFVRCFLRSPLVPSERESPVGWLQSVLAMPVGEER